jgi:3-oxoacyl-[acyl-carrier protein] reductase
MATAMTGGPYAAYDLSGRVAVVTGAASGIGEATSQLLAGAGAAVVCADINVEGAEATLDEIKRAGGEGLVVRTDVTSRREVENLVATAVSQFGRIDAMCNIAGAMFPGRIEDLDDALIEAGLSLNLRSVLYGTQYAIRAMKPAGRGSIVNVSSAAIDVPFPGIGVYALTKAAVAMLSMTAATEAGEYGIRVNAIAPGTTITPFSTWRLHRPDGTIDQDAMDSFLESQRALSPLGVSGEAIDQAILIHYLVSDASKFATGNIFRANGGQAMPW